LYKIRPFRAKKRILSLNLPTVGVALSNNYYPAGRIWLEAGFVENGLKNQKFQKLLLPNLPI